MSALYPLAERDNGQAVWLPELVQHIASFLPDNDIACTLRLVSKATSQLFSRYTCVKLSLPCPEHAFAARWGVTGALHALTFKQRRKLLTLTAASGVIPNLKVALVAIAATLTDEALQPDSVAPGQLCPWLRYRGCWWLGDVLAMAAKAGRQAVCEWLLACGCPCRKLAVYAAARGGRLGLMDWLLGQEPGLREDLDAAFLLKCAAKGCSLGDLQRLYGEWAQPQQISGYTKGRILAATASSPTPDWQAKVEWLEAQGYPRDTYVPGWKVAAAAALSDSVSRLVWLRERGYPMDNDAARVAAEAGNMAALEHLLDSVANSPMDVSLSSAARDCRLATLKALYAKGRVDGVSEFLIAKDITLSERISLLQSAASSGRLAVVVWVVDTFRVPSSELQRCMVSAVCSGSLEVVRWLVGRGCRLDKGLLWGAARSGCGVVLEWLVEELGGPAQDYAPYTLAINGRDVATLRLLGRLGVPMKNGDSIYGIAAAGKGGVPVLRCLWEQLRYPFNPTKKTFVDWIKEYCSLACLRWLSEEVGCPVDLERALNAMKQRCLPKPGDEELKQWLLAKQQQQQQHSKPEEEADEDEEDEKEVEEGGEDNQH